MEDFQQISHSQYYCIEWISNSPKTIPLGNTGPVPAAGKAKSVNEGLTSVSMPLLEISVVYARINKAGVVRIRPLGGPITLAARISKDCHLRWREGEPLATSAGDVSFGTIDAALEIHLPPAEVTFVLAPSHLFDTPAVHLATGTRPAFEVLMAQASALVGCRLTPPLKQLCEASLRSLMALALADCDRETQAAGGTDALYREILLDIAAQCRRQDYGLAQVAQRHKINVRTLQKMFQKRGTTLKEYITDQRLQFARDALQDPAQAGKKVSDIAFEAGFNDVTTFNRSFRKRFGRSPSAFRSESGAGAAA